MTMEEQKENNTEPQTEDFQPSADGQTKEKGRRQISSISFPYVHLEAAESGAKSIFNNAGMSEITLAQAATAMNASATSSGFRGDLSAMKLFGLIEGEQGRVRLTELGRSIAEAETAASARVEAFERIPLYIKIKANHNGKSLPKPQALEKEFVELGVSQKQAERARQIFERSAKHAGFIKPGSERFVEPIVPSRKESKTVDADDLEETGQHQNGKKSHGGGGGNGGIYHPFIEGLLKTLPEPETNWEIADRAKWLQTAASIFGLIYKDKGGGEIKVVAATINSSPTSYPPPS